MASGSDDGKMDNPDGGRSKGRKDKHFQTEGPGCWLKLKFIGKCMPLRSGNGRKDEKTEPADDIGGDQPIDPAAISLTNSDSITAVSISNNIDQLKIASNLRRFSFHELKLVTRNFRPEHMLGEGGFGRVFKGWINEKGTTPGRPGTGIPVAVKTLNREGLQGHKEWLAEIVYLGELQHENLVKLIGYCIEDEERLLVYEFMPRGSLENHLFRRNTILGWFTRVKILLGAAKGLVFLHEEVTRPVIFRDFKTSNILLDADFNAKLSDFGLAKDGPEGDSTHVSTRIMGTQGYAAPEYVMTGHLSPKSDVYSFGVVLLEMLSGRRAIDKSRPSGEQNLVEWARARLVDRKRFYQLIDPRLDGNFSIKGAWKTSLVAARCLQHNPKARPQMSEVIEVLTSSLDLNDMASASPSFQAVQSSRNTQRTKSGSSRTPSRSPNGMEATPPRSPRGRQVTPPRSPKVLQVAPPKSPTGMQAPPARSPNVVQATPARSPIVRQATPARSPTVMEASPLWSPSLVQASPFWSPNVMQASSSRSPNVMKASSSRSPNVMQASSSRSPNVMQASSSRSPNFMNASPLWSPDVLHPSPSCSPNVMNASIYNPPPPLWSPNPFGSRNH